MGKQFIDFTPTSSIDNTDVFPLQKNADPYLNKGISWSDLKARIQEVIDASIVTLTNLLTGQIDAKVSGPSSATVGRIAVFSNVNGKVVSESSRLETELVASTETLVVDGHLPVFHLTGGKTIRNSSILASNIYSSAKITISASDPAPGTPANDKDLWFTI